MKKQKNKTLIYILLSVVGLFLSILPIVFGNNIGLTQYSIIPFAFAIASVIYAIIAFKMKDKGNLFVAGKFWLYRMVSFSFESKAHTEDEEYKQEFALSAFIYCISIPAYLSFAFLADDYYSALAQALGWTTLRLFAIIIIVVVLPMIKYIKKEKQQRIKDEADRKEQERRESMGKWK